MKFKKNVKPIYTTEDFWYAINNGYFPYKDILATKADADKVSRALRLLNELEQSATDLGIWGDE